MPNQYQAIPDDKKYKLDKKTGCWNFIQALHPKTGYGRFWNKLAHRYFYEKYKGKIPKGLVIDHLCKNRKCVNPNHLEPVSQALNVRRGNLPKLNLQKVAIIKSLYRQGFSQQTLANRFSVNQSQISRAVTGSRWR